MTARHFATQRWTAITSRTVEPTATRNQTSTELLPFETALCSYPPRNPTSSPSPTVDWSTLLSCTSSANKLRPNLIAAETKQTFCTTYKSTIDINICVYCCCYSNNTTLSHNGMACPQVTDEGTDFNVEGSCEYIEKAVVDSQQGVVLHLGVWARG